MPYQFTPVPVEAMQYHDGDGTILNLHGQVVDVEDGDYVTRDEFGDIKVIPRRYFEANYQETTENAPLAEAVVPVVAPSDERADQTGAVDPPPMTIPEDVEPGMPFDPMTSDPSVAAPVEVPASQGVYPPVPSTPTSTEVPWFSEPPEASLVWSDGENGYLHFTDPKGNGTSVAVTTKPPTFDDRGHVWHISLETAGETKTVLATVSPRVHYVGDWHTPNPVQFRIIANEQQTTVPNGGTKG